MALLITFTGEAYKQGNQLSLFSLHIASPNCFFNKRFSKTNSADILAMLLSNIFLYLCKKGQFSYWKCWLHSWCFSQFVSFIAGQIRFFKCPFSIQMCDSVRLSSYDWSHWVSRWVRQSAASILTLLHSIASKSSLRVFRSSTLQKPLQCCCAENDYLQHLKRPICKWAYQFYSIQRLCGKKEKACMFQSQTMIGYITNWIVSHWKWINNQPCTQLVVWALLKVRSESNFSDGSTSWSISDLRLWSLVTKSE